MEDSLGTKRIRRGGKGRGYQERTGKGCRGGPGRFLEGNQEEETRRRELEGGGGGCWVTWGRVMWRVIQTVLESNHLNNVNDGGKLK